MRTLHGQFAKGVSGNPAGRPIGAINKASARLKDLLHALDPQAVKRIREIIQSDRLWRRRPEIVLRAIELAWAYGHGRPRPQADAEDGGDADTQRFDLLTILTEAHRIRDTQRAAGVAERPSAERAA